MRPPAPPSMTLGDAPSWRRAARTASSSAASIRIGLPVEVANTIVRDEECPDGPVRLEGNEPTFAPVEVRGATIRPARLQDVVIRFGIPQCLSHLQIVLLGDRAEIRAVLCVMLFQQVVRPEALPARPQRRGSKKCEDRDDDGIDTEPFHPSHTE